MLHHILLLALLLESPSTEAVSVTYLRLKLAENSSAQDSNICPWGQRVVSRSSCWAEESTTTLGWQDVPELPRRTKVGIALGGGVVRGMVHIGILRALEENNVPIHAISGTSMGAILGGLYACGYSVDTLEWIAKRGIDWETFFSDQPPREAFPLWKRLREEPKEPGINLDVEWSRPDRWLKQSAGLRAAQKMIHKFAELTLEADYRAGFDFDNFTVPFGAMITDIDRGKPKLMRQGAFAITARASSSFILAFEPVRIGDTLYVDGGVLDNLPVDAFIPFDSVRAPENTIRIDGKDLNYVIAAYPSRMRKPVIEKRKFQELSGLDVVNRVFPLAREYYIVENWDKADAGIDVHVRGAFDFSPEKIDEMIRAGYSAAKEKMLEIKRGIAIREDSIRSRTQSRQVALVSSIETEIHPKRGSPLTPEERRRISKAIRVTAGSYIEKIDVCDALKRVHDLGDFQPVTARVERENRSWTVTFLVQRTRTYNAPNRMVVRMIPELPCSPAIRKAIAREIRARKRALDFNKIQELAQTNSVQQGVVSLTVDSIRLRSSGSNDTLIIYTRGGTSVKGVAINCDDAWTRQVLGKEFNSLASFGPRDILDKIISVRRRFQIKTIAVEGFENDSLVVAVSTKPTSTVQFPVLCLRQHEGINWSADVVGRRTTIFSAGDWFPRVRWTANYPLRNAVELLRGDELRIGLESCRSFVPQATGSWRSLTEVSDSSSEKTFREIDGRITIPMYLSDIAVITPGIDATRVDNTNVKWQTAGILGIQWDNLDRIVFPESGSKGSLGVKLGGVSERWQAFPADTTFFWRAKLRALAVPWKHTIQKSVRTVITGKLVGTWYSGETPYHERYGFGGFTPVGSRQIELLDSEDFPGYGRNQIMEQLMWMTSVSARIAFMETSVLGIRATVHLEASYYLAQAIPAQNGLLWDQQVSWQSWLVGGYLDTSLLNIGIVFEKSDTFSKLISPFVSIVFYGF